MITLEENDRGVIIPVKAQASARKNAIVGERQGAARIAVTATPEKGKANRAIIDLLSETLGFPKSAIELISGDTSPQKRFLIVGADADEIQKRLVSEIARQS